MAKYKLELKPIRLYGIEALPADRLQFFGIMLNALSQTLLMVEGVTKAEVTDEYFLLIEGSDQLDTTLSSFHEQAIITKLE